MKTIEETNEIANNTELFKKYGYTGNSIVRYELLDTEFIYTTPLCLWLKNITQHHTIFYYDFQEVFEIIMDAEYVSDESKTKIVFHLAELNNMFIEKRQ